MKKYLVNFSTIEFKRAQEKLNASAVRFGIDETISWNKSDLKTTDFWRENRAILKQKRGAGYWLWKPYIILKALEKAALGDIVVYADSGIEIIQPLDPLFELLNERRSIIVFSCGGHLNKTWTKRDCFKLLECDSEKYWNTEQRLASFQLYKKTPVTIKFVTEWLEMSRDARAITDMPNQLGEDNLDGFVDHRHDQSIFSLLTIRDNIEMFRDPTQFGDEFKLDSKFSNSKYGTILNHHRKHETRMISTLKSIDAWIKDSLEAAVEPPPYSEKIKIIGACGKEYDLDTLIETGTYLGDTIFALKDQFKKLISIELDPGFYAKAIERFRPYKQVSILEGDSGTVLPKVLENINTPTLFWLDGHYSGIGTAKGNADTPVFKEITSVINHHVKGHVMLIDDARCFNGDNDYPTLWNVVRTVKKLDPTLSIIVENDIIRIFKKKDGPVEYPKVGIKPRLALGYRRLRAFVRGIIK